MGVRGWQNGWGLDGFRALVSWTKAPTSGSAPCECEATQHKGTTYSPVTVAALNVPRCSLSCRKGSMGKKRIFRQKRIFQNFLINTHIESCKSISDELIDLSLSAFRRNLFVIEQPTHWLVVTCSITNQLQICHQFSGSRENPFWTRMVESLPTVK